MMQLRYYQVRARDNVIEAWESGIDKTLLSMATGTGKTIVFAAIAEILVRNGGRVLILAHREELLQQAADKIFAVTGLVCAVEKAEFTAEDSWYRITVGSVQTLMSVKRQARFEKEHYDYIIVDEAHHCLANSYRKIFAHFDCAKVLGVTATPDRGDMRNLGEFFQSLAYEYPLPVAIRDGFLAPIKVQTIPLKIELNGCAQQAGDFKAGDLSDALAPYLDAIAKEMVLHCMDRKTVVFLPLIATSQKFCEILNGYGFRAAEVNCESDDRKEIQKDFTNNRYNVLCNSMLLTEGWDEPSVDCIVNLRATKIRSLYAQICGRGTRLFPGKEYLLLLDFLWHVDKHSLCHPANLICDNQDLADKVTEILARPENADGCDLEATVVGGQSEVVEERERLLAEKLAAQRGRQKALVDPLQFEVSIKAEDLESYTPAFGWEMAPPSAAQIKKLESSGIFPDEIQNAGMAAKLIDRIQARRDQGLTTPKQIRCLERYGFQHVGTWEFDSAKKLIDRIAANRWRMPDGLNPKQYVPIKIEQEPF
jgi:superfamily II DNA or RNA helicase